jgi:hypothetical protein
MYWSLFGRLGLERFKCHVRREDGWFDSKLVNLLVRAIASAWHVRVLTGDSDPGHIFQSSDHNLVDDIVDSNDTCKHNSTQKRA